MVLIGIIVGFTLLGLVLSWTPKVKIMSQSVMSMPQSTQSLRVSELSVEDKNVFTPSAKFDVQVTALQGGDIVDNNEGRLLQNEDVSNLSPGIIAINNEKSGVSVIAETP